MLPELAGHDDSKVSNADCYAFGALFSVGAPIECQYEFHRVFSVVVLRLVLSISSGFAAIEIRAGAGY